MLMCSKEFVLATDQEKCHESNKHQRLLFLHNGNKPYTSYLISWGSYFLLSLAHNFLFLNELNLADND